MRNTFHKIFRRISIVFMAVLIGLGATGFSYQVHFCHGSVKDVSLFATFGDDAIGCSCSGASKAVCGNASDTRAKKIEKQHCCKNLFFYNKLTVETQVAASLLFKNIEPFVLHKTLNGHLIINYFKQELLFCSGDVGNPFSGIDKVIFFSQLRIPAPNYIS